MESMSFSPVEKRSFEWLDIEDLSDEARRLLSERLDLDAGTVAGFLEKSLIPRVRPFDDRLLLVLHSLDTEGHLLELDLLIGEDFLVTVHQRLNEAVGLDVALRETERVRTEIEGGHFAPEAPINIAIAIILAIAETLEETLAEAAAKAGVLDRRMREGDTGDPEKFLEELFSARRDLVTIANRAAQSRDALTTTMGVARSLDQKGLDLVSAAGERFERLSHVCDGERGFLQEVLDYHEHRTNIKMNFAMERLALVAAVVLPVNALAGIIGMNTIATSNTNLIHTASLIVVMIAMAGLILLWAKKKDWW